jgi:hypothetical protein
VKARISKRYNSMFKKFTEGGRVKGRQEAAQNQQ